MTLTCHVLYAFTFFLICHILHTIVMVFSWLRSPALKTRMYAPEVSNLLTKKQIGLLFVFFFKNLTCRFPYTTTSLIAQTRLDELLVLLQNGFRPINLKPILLQAYSKWYKNWAAIKLVYEISFSMTKS